MRSTPNNLQSMVKLLADVSSATDVGRPNAAAAQHWASHTTSTKRSVGDPPQCFTNSNPLPNTPTLQRRSRWSSLRSRCVNAASPSSPPGSNLQVNTARKGRIRARKGDLKPKLRVNTKTLHTIAQKYITKIKQ
jgi:hypothetical protein